MTAVADVANEFLSHKRVAVTGVSRTPKSHGGNVVFNRLKAATRSIRSTRTPRWSRE